MSTKRPANRDGESALAVSAWPLRRKVALALAVPLLLAGTLGGLRVQSDLVEASNSSSSAQQVTALRPAVDYLTAAEQAMVAAVGTDQDSQAALEEALADIRTAGRELLESKESADLTDDQRYQVDAVLDLSQALRDEDAITLSPGTWVAQLRQLQSGVTQLVTTIVNEQINPEPRLELLSQTLAGRFSLAMQQALVATERTGETGSLELFSELGAEGAAIDRLASALGTSEQAVASCAPPTPSGSARSAPAARTSAAAPRTPTTTASSARCRTASTTSSRPRPPGRAPTPLSTRRSPWSPWSRRSCSRCSSPACCSTRSAGSARARWRWRTSDCPRRSRASVRARSPARSRRSTSRRRRRSASWPGPWTTCTARPSCWPPARPACGRRSARCSSPCRAATPR